MKAGVIQQGGKENERLYSRSTKRKLVKSPLKIKQKIKELEVKAQLKQKRIILSKDKPAKFNEQPSQRLFMALPQAIGRTPPQYLERDRLGWHSAHKASNYVLEGPYHKLTAKVEYGVPITSKGPDNRQKSPQESQRMVLHKASSRTLASQSGQLTQLKEQNQRYKRIYSHSLEKMQQLQARLKAIRQKHDAQKQQLEGTMQCLKQRIEQKKVNLGHLYTHTQHDFLILHDCIITETENENSSILENLSKRFQPSSLSIDSK